MSEMLEGLLVAAETPVVEMEELQGIIAEGLATIPFPADLEATAKRNSPVRCSCPGVHPLIPGVALPAVVAAKPYLERMFAREGSVRYA